jgi:site-specific recombinase XerD
MMASTDLADADCIRRFLESPPVRRLSDSSRQDKRRTLRRLARSMGGRGLVDVHTADIEAWLVDSGPYTSDTRTTLLVHLNAFYEWADRDGLVDENPVTPLRCHRRSLAEALAVDPSATAGESQPTLRQLAGAYLAGRVQRRDIGQPTARNALCALEGLCRVYGDEPVANLSQEHIEEWQATIGHLAPATRRGRLSYVKGFCAWLARRKFVPADPTVEIARVRLPRYLPRGLPMASVSALLAHCPDVRGELMVLLEVQEGLRCGEVAGLQLSDVDFVDRTVRIVGKGGHVRLLPVSDETWAVLERYLAAAPLTAGPLIRSKRDLSSGLTSDTISGLISEWLSDAKVKRYARDGASAHSLRHAAATDMLRSGAHLRDVQAALGHASLATTQRYLPTVVNDLRTAMGGRKYR